MKKIIKTKKKILEALSDEEKTYMITPKEFKKMEKEALKKTEKELVKILMKKIHPYLIGKREQAEILLKFVDTQDNKMRIKLYNQMGKLNKKGGKSKWKMQSSA